MTRVRLLVGTKKGAFILEGDAVAARLGRPRPAVRGLAGPRPASSIPATGAILAAGRQPWYGPAVWRSEDRGDDVDPLLGRDDVRRRRAGRHDGLEPRDRADGALWAGVEPAGLFRSDDGGGTWSPRRGADQPPDPADLAARAPAG